MTGAIVLAPGAKVAVQPNEGPTMLKRDKLEAMLGKITDDEFGAIWTDTYGYLPEGSRSELAKDFAAEQYDGELDGCIALAESFLTHAPLPKPKNRWIPPR